MNKDLDLHKRPSLLAPSSFISDAAKKSTVSYTVHTCSKQHLHNKKEDFTESTGVVPAKYPLKVKLELFTTLECQS